MFSSYSETAFLWKKKTWKKLGRATRSTCVFHVKKKKQKTTLGLFPKHLKSYPFPFKEKKFILFLFLLYWINLHLKLPLSVVFGFF